MWKEKRKGRCALQSCVSASILATLTKAKSPSRSLLELLDAKLSPSFADDGAYHWLFPHLFAFLHLEPEENKSFLSHSQT